MQVEWMNEQIFFSSVSVYSWDLVVCLLACFAAFFFFNIHVFIWLRFALCSVGALMLCGLSTSSVVVLSGLSSPQGAWGLSSWTRDWTQIPCIARQNLSLDHQGSPEPSISDVKNACIVAAHGVSPRTRGLHQGQGNTRGVGGRGLGAALRPCRGGAGGSPAQGARGCGDGGILDGSRGPDGTHNQERRPCGSRVPRSTRGLWRSHCGVLESALLMACPEVKGL